LTLLIVGGRPDLLDEGRNRLTVSGARLVTQNAFCSSFGKLASTSIADNKPGPSIIKAAYADLVSINPCQAGKQPNLLEPTTTLFS
jgi:hypothetical protein